MSANPSAGGAPGAETVARAPATAPSGAARAALRDLDAALPVIFAEVRAALARPSLLSRAAAGRRPSSEGEGDCDAG